MQVLAEMCWNIREVCNAFYLNFMVLYYLVFLARLYSFSACLEDVVIADLIQMTMMMRTTAYARA